MKEWGANETEWTDSAMRTLFSSSMELNSVHVWATVKLSFKSFLALLKNKQTKKRLKSTYKKCTLVWMYYEYYEPRWLIANSECTDWLSREDDLHRKLVSSEKPKWNKMASFSRNRFGKWLFVELVIIRSIGESSNSFKAKQKNPGF